MNPPVLTAEEQQRKDEVDRYLAARYQTLGWKIVDTTQTYIGDIVDWLDPTSVPGSDEPPPPLPDMTLPEDVQLQTSELVMSPELQGPAGTIPMYRPTFAVYVRGETGATSVEDFIANYQEMGQPAGQKRLYAGLGATADNLGLSAWVNQFVGADVEDGTFTLIELATICLDDQGKPKEVIGIVASRDKVNFGDAVVRLQVEFFTAGPKFLGDDKGGWEGFSHGFVPAAGRRYGPGTALVPLSTVGGPQYASFFWIKPAGDKWWIGTYDTWLGYYPANLFQQISQRGVSCQAAWYGEVFDPTPTDWTSTDMGSGQFPSTGYGSAAYVRLPVYYDTSNVPTSPNAAAPYMTPYDTSCYDRTQLIPNMIGEPTFFLGGSGGDAPGCN